MREVEKFYLRIGEEIVDHLFDNGYFCKELKREDMRKLDDLFGFYIQSYSESAVKCNQFTRRIRDMKEGNKNE